MMLLICQRDYQKQESTQRSLSRKAVIHLDLSNHIEYKHTPLPMKLWEVSGVLCAKTIFPLTHVFDIA